MRLVHCSDVHITCDYFSMPPWKLGWRRTLALFELGPGGRAHHYARAPETLARIAADVDAHGAEHLIVSGDLTAYAMPPEFDGARKALAPLVDQPRRCTVVPGNHDTYTADAVRDRLFEASFAALLASDLPGYVAEGPFPLVRLLGDDVAVVGLSSARLNAAPGLSYGRIGSLQLEALRALLQAPELVGRAVLVVVHHAPFRADGRPDKPTHGLKDADALLSLLPGPRFAVLHGHIHHRYHHPATDARPHIFGAGSSTQLGREGYWLLEAGRGGISGTRVDLARPADSQARA